MDNFKLEEVSALEAEESSEESSEEVSDSEESKDLDQPEG